MPRLRGFIGGTYTPRSYKADVERTINLVPEIIESKEGENQGWLGRRPGLNIFGLYTGVSGENIYADPATGRTFFVAATKFVEQLSDGTTTVRGTVAASSATVPPTITGNGNGGGQVITTSGGLLYCFTLASNTFAAVTTNVEANLIQSNFMDGYFLLLNTHGILQWSALEDGTTWDALDIAQRSTMADPWLGFTILHREIRLFGAQSAESWTDTGNLLIPFQLVQGSVNEQGIVGVFALQVLANTVVWVGRNVQGQGIVWMASGYIPQRISTHAVEAALAKSAQLASARAMVIQQEGHTFYLLRVPDLETTWVYDIATGLWCEWAQLVDDTTNPWTWEPWPGVATTFAFGRQLIVGAMSGYTVGTLDDTGSASNDLLAISSNASPLFLYDWGGTLRNTYTLTGSEGAGATAARPTSPTQAFSSIRGGANVNIYAGASVTVPSASGVVSSVGSNQWIRNYAAVGSSVGGTTIQYLVVAGGGGQGDLSTGGLVGGGGGGAVKTGTLGVVAGTFPVVIGLGGAGGVNGSNSSWNGVTAPGGGHGGAEQTAGGNGGNGGGAGNALFLGVGATGGDLGSGDWQSYPGGTGSDGYNGERDDINSAGGGAGAGGLATGCVQNTGGTGGPGLSSSISGAAVLYASGGSGAGLTAPGTTPTSAYGGGGGAQGAIGQNGVVILSYTTGAITATGGTITTSGGKTIHTFTTSGDFVITVAPTPTKTWAVADVDSVTVSLAFLDSNTNAITFKNTAGTTLGTGTYNNTGFTTPFYRLALFNGTAGFVMSDYGIRINAVQSDWTTAIGNVSPASVVNAYAGFSCNSSNFFMMSRDFTGSPAHYISTMRRWTLAGAGATSWALPALGFGSSPNSLDLIIVAANVSTDGSTLYYQGRNRASTYSAVKRYDLAGSAPLSDFVSNGSLVVEWIQCLSNGHVAVGWITSTASTVDTISIYEYDSAGSVVHGPYSTTTWNQHLIMPVARSSDTVIYIPNDTGSGMKSVDLTTGTVGTAVSAPAGYTFGGSPVYGFVVVTS